MFHTPVLQTNIHREGLVLQVSLDAGVSVVIIVHVPNPTIAQTNTYISRGQSRCDPGSVSDDK